MSSPLSIPSMFFLRLAFSVNSFHPPFFYLLIYYSFFLSFNFSLCFFSSNLFLPFVILFAFSLSYCPLSLFLSSSLFQIPNFYQILLGASLVTPFALSIALPFLFLSLSHVFLSSPENKLFPSSPSSPKTKNKRVSSPPHFSPLSPFPSSSPSFSNLLKTSPIHGGEILRRQDCKWLPVLCGSVWLDLTCPGLIRLGFDLLEWCWLSLPWVTGFDSAWNALAWVVLTGLGLVWLDFFLFGSLGLIPIVHGLVL